MKLFFWILLAGLSFNGCKKTSVRQVNELTASLVGKWELQEEQIGMTPVKNYAPGNGNRLEFTDSTYKKFSKEILTTSGKYTVVSDNTVLEETGLVLTPGEFNNRIIFDKDTIATKIFLNITKDKLILLSGFFPVDGGSRTIYQRM